MAVERGAAGEIGFVTLLRAAACAMVVYSHLVDGATHAYYHIRWAPGEAVTENVLTPLGITEGAGFLGVALFFLISGFVIAHTAQHECRRSFIVKRVLRIYPPLLAAIALTLALSHGETVGISGIPWRKVVLSATLMDVFASVPHPVMAVSWTLSIEMLFYFLLAPLIPLVHTRPAAVAAILTTWSVLVTDLCDWWYRATRFGPPHAVGVVLEYLPVFACGMIAWTWWSGRVGGRRALALGMLAIGAVIHNVWRSQPAYLAGTDGHVRQIVYAVILFVVFLRMSGRISVAVPIRWLAKVSYSVYLIHFALGFWLLDRLIPRVDYTAALVAAIAAIGATSALFWRYVERPSQRLARAILARGDQAEPASSAIPRGPSLGAGARSSATTSAVLHAGADIRKRSVSTY